MCTDSVAATQSSNANSFPSEPSPPLAPQRAPPWDVDTKELSTQRTTQQLIDRIGTSTRSTQRTSKDQPGRIGTSIRVSTTLVPPSTQANTHHQEPQPLFSPVQRRNYCLLFFSQREERKEHANNTIPKYPSEDPRSSLSPRKLNITFRKGMTPETPMTLSRGGKGFPC
jgi:hypothetical protein